jgi:hypothetical protein
MDEYIASGRNAILAGKVAVMLARVRDVDRFVELAVSVAEIQDVAAFGRLVIPLPGLGPHWITAESNVIGFDNFPLSEKLQRPLFL